MLTVVLIVNAIIVLLCMVVTWQVWRLRWILRQAEDALIVAEKSTHAVLHGAPDAIYRGQMGLRQLRGQYQQLEPQLWQARQLLLLLSLGQIVWRKRSMSPRLAKRSRQRPRWHSRGL